MYDASSRKDIRRAEKLAKLAEENRINYVVAAMSTMQGRVWFHDFLSACHIFADPFTGDALREAYAKGERNIGLKAYMDIVQHCPDSFIQMMKEANHARSISDTSNASPDEPRCGEHDGVEDGGWNLAGSDSTTSEPDGDTIQ